MEFSNDLEYITIFDKRSKISTLANKLAGLSAIQVKEFFANRENKLPRRLNMLALMSVLNEKIKTLNSQSLPKDMFTKLQFYKDFNEFQLQSLFEKICDEEDFLNYRTILWTLILRNFECLNLQDGEVQYLSKIKKIKVDDFSSYERIIFEVCEEVNKHFDGVPVKNIENDFNNSFSSDELRRLAEKYGFIIPSRLKKNEFTDFVKQILKSKRKLTVALGKEIDQMTIVQLNSLCELHEITLSSNLKKNEIIYLLMFLIKVNKLSTSELKISFNELGIVPLEFKVDLDSIDNFGRGEAKDVIILPKSAEEVEPTAEEKPLTQDDLIKEIARKLGLIQDEETEPKVEEHVKEQPKPVKKTDSVSNGKMTPAERLALARKRKQELAEQRRLEEQGLQEETVENKIPEPVVDSKPVVEESVSEPEKNEIDVQSLIEKLRNKNNVQESVEETVNIESVDDGLVEDNVDLEPVEENIKTEEFGESETSEFESYDDSEIENDESNESELEDDSEMENDESDETELEDDSEMENDESDETELEDDSEIENDESNETELEDEFEVEDNVSDENDEEVVEEILEEKEESSVEEKMNNESYDSEFNSTEFIKKGEAIENPYYKNKKLASNKKKVLKIVLYTVGLIAVFCVGVVASRFIK